jgi:Uma2 family endonuclease
LLTVEILSPSTRRADRVRKREIYLDEGVPEYWIVDLDARLIERWRQGDQRPEIVTESLIWQPVAGVPALEVDLPRFFAGVLD